MTIVLSGYNECELVREAFRLGVYDYLLKSDLSARMVGGILEKLNRQYFGNQSQPFPPCLRRDRVAKRRPLRLVLFGVADFKRQSVRLRTTWRKICKANACARQIPAHGRQGGDPQVYPSMPSSITG
ncbi:MAG: hypothetical protein ACLR0U_08610 [Enterocloster clostridioformis]